MEIVYAPESLPTRQKKAIFLAGPTPRSADVPSWRPTAIEQLKAYGYDGIVFVPEPRDGKFTASYDEQVGWEDRGLNRADVILFWIPRDKTTMPGFTTNDEYGFWKGRDPAKVVLGAPEDAVNVRYQRDYATKFSIPQEKTLAAACLASIEKLGDGAERSGGECDVPLHIWNTKAFKDWYSAQHAVGNRLDGARVEWVFRVPSTKKFVFAWAMHVNVFVHSENRNKVNEFIFARTDISTIVAYHKGNTLMDTKVVLVREFRSPAATPDGFIWECPGGSSPKPGQDPKTIASEELYEETGLKLSPERFKKHEVRQLTGTLSTHKAHVFSVSLADGEFTALYQDEVENKVHGLIADSEMTYVRLRTVAEILASRYVDWSMIGVIMSVLSREFL